MDVAWLGTRNVVDDTQQPSTDAVQPQVLADLDIYGRVTATDRGHPVCIQAIAIGVCARTLRIQLRQRLKFSVSIRVLRPFPLASLPRQEDCTVCLEGGDLKAGATLAGSLANEQPRLKLCLKDLEDLVTADANKHLQRRSLSANSSRVGR